ncbi:DinB family protein [Pontibacter sp. 172403-2]|uniref:DinB family protein n=1 Tax=Pontibacter rufus TaxID=2791028 RepID=UPI0018AF8235|nr:DinB family protein [Pontibacter sp. 172403-2]MBF9255747.1 DinB family protein [Pontibacter sp. 172403-2]
MKIIEKLLKEIDEEGLRTRKMLTIVPDDKYDWRPHPKSMPVKDLALHIADLPTWITLAVTTDELDFAASPYNPGNANSTEELLMLFEKNLAKAKADMDQATEEQLEEPWTLRKSDAVYMTLSKYETVRHALAQTIHHRAQLGLYLRLLDIPIPGSYGPSADEQG